MPATLGDRVSPIDWAIRPLRHYADFSGRAPRAEYWWYVLAIIITGTLIGLLDRRVSAPIYGQLGPLSLLFTLAFILPGLAVAVRRIHDTDRSGWWALVRVPSYALTFGGSSMLQLSQTFKQLPVLGMVALLVFIFGWVIAAFAVFIFEISAGTQGPNRYGPDPYGPNQLEEVFA